MDGLDDWGSNLTGGAAYLDGSYTSDLLDSFDGSDYDWGMGQGVWEGMLDDWDSNSTGGSFDWGMDQGSSNVKLDDWGSNATGLIDSSASETYGLDVNQVGALSTNEKNTVGTSAADDVIGRAATPDGTKEEKSWWASQNGQAQSSVITGLFNAAGGFFAAVQKSKSEKNAARQAEKVYQRNRGDKLADDAATREQLLADRAALWARQDLTDTQKYEREKELLQMRLSNDVTVSSNRYSGNNDKPQGGASTFNPGLIRKG